MVSWKDKVAIITGGGSGIGRATAMLFAGRGARVVVADMNEAGGRETVAMIGGRGGALFVKTDMTSEAEVQGLVDKAVATFGGVHLLHNNAAILVHHDRIEDVPVESFRRVVDVNLTSLFIAARAVVPVMRRQGGGVIINTASLGAVVPVVRAISYACAKAGVLGLTRTLAAQLQPAGIRVNAILPNSVDTPMVRDDPAFRNRPPERARVLQPAEVAWAVATVAEREDLTGAFVAVDPTPSGPRLTRLKDHEREPLAG